MTLILDMVAARHADVLEASTTKASKVDSCCLSWKVSLHVVCNLKGCFRCLGLISCVRKKEDGLSSIDGMTARILLGAALAALASYSLVLLGCNGRTVFFPSFAPSFSLELRSGSRELNARMESAEQKGLFKHWDASYETGINIGVYVGTSCIFLDKLLEANQAGGRVGLRTVCVEPNTGVLPLLQKNLAASGSQVQSRNGS